MSQIFILVMTLLTSQSFSEPVRTADTATVEQQEKKEQEMTTYYFIRHAEKDETDPTEKDPELTPEGKARTKKWTAVFKEVPFDMVYSSKYKRTLSTAQPIAEDHKLQVLTYNPGKVNDVDFQQKTKGKTVLVVGHSNTNPKFVNAILGENTYKDIDEAESGSLFIVSVSPNGEKSCQLLYIN